MSEINKKSYLSQVKQLRKVAISALKRYPIDIIELKFVNHGENTTYKIISKKGNFLLRIHRKNNHSKNAIIEELKWVKQLSGKTGLIQKPIPSVNGLLVEEVTFGDPLDSRFCSMLTWVDGKMRYRSLTQNTMFNAGQLAGKLHKNTFKRKVKHRNYWDTEGLLGVNATFGSLHNIKPEITKAEYKVLEECRIITLKKIEQYKSKNPHKFSLIHADLHFGNIVWKKDEPIPIDFDDCGFGFQMYDLAITLGSLTYLFKLSKKKAKQPFIEFFFEGYSSIQDLSKEDLEILPWLKLTRNLVMLGWGYERRDHPDIFEHFKKNIKNKIKYYKKVLKEGPDSLY